MTDALCFKLLSPSLGAILDRCFRGVGGLDEGTVQSHRLRPACGSYMFKECEHPGQ